MTRRGFDYRRAVKAINPNLLAQLPPRLPKLGEQAQLWEEDEQQQEAAKRAGRRHAARERQVSADASFKTVGACASEQGRLPEYDDADLLAGSERGNDDR